MFQNFSMFQSSRNLKEATIFFFPPIILQMETNFVRISMFWIQLNSSLFNCSIALGFVLYIYTHVYVSYLFLVYLASTRINLLLLLLTNERSFVCVIYPRCREQLHLRARRISGINESVIREQLSSRYLNVSKLRLRRYWNVWNACQMRIMEQNRRIGRKEKSLNLHRFEIQSFSILTFKNWQTNNIFP